MLVFKTNNKVTINEWKKEVKKVILTILGSEDIFWILRLIIFLCINKNNNKLNILSQLEQKIQEKFIKLILKNFAFN